MLVTCISEEAEPRCCKSIHIRMVLKNMQVPGDCPTSAIIFKDLLKPHGQSKPNFIQIICRKEVEFCL